MATTDAAGYFIITPVSPGDHLIEAKLAGYLPAKTEVNVIAGQRITLPKVILLGGDADGNGIIDRVDLKAIGDAFNTTDGNADINDDSIVDIYDLVLVGKNFGKTGSPWLGIKFIS